MIEPSMRIQVFLFAITLFLTSECFAEKRAKDFLKQPDAWFSSSECLTIAENIFSYQSNEGGWPKNTDTVSIRIVRSNSGIGVQRWKPIPR